MGFAGASGGALLALCMCLQLSYDDVYPIVQPFLSHPQSVLFSTLDIENFVTHFGIQRGEAMREIVQRVLRCAGLSDETTFERLFNLTHRRFICSGTNLNLGCPVLFSAETTPRMKVVEAVFISMCIPFVFSPVEFEGNLHVDGALSCNLPMGVFPPNETLVITFDSPPRYPLNGWTDYVQALTRLGWRRDEESEILKASVCSIVVRHPEENGAPCSVNVSMDSNDCDSLITCGYAAVLNALLRAEPSALSIEGILGHLADAHRFSRLMELLREVADEAPLEDGPCNQR